MTPEDKTKLMAQTQTWGIDQVITGSVGLIHGPRGVPSEHRPGSRCPAPHHSGHWAFEPLVGIRGPL